MLTELDIALKKDIFDFIKQQEAEKNQPFGKVLVAELLKELINGNCMITGCAKNDRTGKMWVEYSFYEKVQEDE